MYNDLRRHEWSMQAWIPVVSSVLHNSIQLAGAAIHLLYIWLEGYRTSMYRALPVQLTPKYLGSLQIHTKDPLVLWHTVRPLQLCIPFAHSSVSVNQKVVLNYIYHYIYIDIWLDLLKHGYRNLSHTPFPNHVVEHVFFFLFLYIVTFYLFNFYGIFTEYAAVNRLSWASHWLLTYPHNFP